MRTAIPKENRKKKKNDVGSHETKLQKGGRGNSYTWFLTQMANYGILVENLFTK